LVAYNIKLTQIQCKRVFKLVMYELVGKTKVLTYCLYFTKSTSMFWRQKSDGKKPLL